MAQLSEMKQGKMMTIASLSLLLLMFTAFMLPLARADMTDWDNAVIPELQDIHDTPGQTGPVEVPDPDGPDDPSLKHYDYWYDDSKGGSQVESELLYAWIDVDPDWIFVRWDVKEDAAAFDETNMNIYYIVRVDAVAPFDTLVATHLLILGIRSNQEFFVEIQTAAEPKAEPPPWNGVPVGDYYEINPITLDGTEPYDEATALEAKFPRSPYLTGEFWVMSVETHAASSNMGSTSVAQDYIRVSSGDVPWFTDLGMALLATTILAVVIKKKKLVG